MSTDDVKFDRVGRLLTVYVASELDAELAPSVGELVLAEHRSDDDEVALDLSGVSFCDSSGLRMIFRLHQALDSDLCGFAICNPSAAVQRILDMVDQSHLLKIRTS